MTVATAFAPAKVNLYLHVGPVRPDGYHPVSTWMVFADVGDRVEVQASEVEAFETTGPFARDLAGLPGAHNLVRRAADQLLGRVGRQGQALRLQLHKALPVAAGLGGGSSDAGAALRAVRELLTPDLPDAALLEIAETLGADAPACLRSTPVIGEGRGDRLSPSPGLPELHAVLVNPRQACPTAAVYRSYDEGGAVAAADTPALPGRLEDVHSLVACLGKLRNDLERPAATVAPVVGEVLHLLGAQGETLLARLSGSGATAFALVADARAAEALARRLAGLRQDWWITPCRLGGPWPAGGPEQAIG